MKRMTRRIVIAAALSTACWMFASVAVPTSSAWIDKGGASMTLTAVEERPPDLVGPVTPGDGTIFRKPDWKGHGTNPPTPTTSCFTVVIFTTSVEPAPWQVIIETDQPPFNNVPPFTGFQNQIYGEGANYTFAQTDNYALTARYVMTPAPGPEGVSQWASRTTSYTAVVCANTPEPAWQPPGDDTYTQQEPVTLFRNGSQPCVSATVVGHQPFFIGFTVSFNWKTVLGNEVAAGFITPAEYTQWLPYTHWAGAPAGHNAAQGATGNDYLVTLQAYDFNYRNVSSVAPVENAACAY